ncbi:MULTISPECIES: hypothetical protein [Rhizobium]|uniref:Uncharacterized protein n=1 Tax=Rhizobium binae TaxID=1138190 RepID=A0ABV2ML00_9HYPH|nr:MULTISPECIES: hypothetical protein [Rhizobium]NKL49609.1 hypothetical protein [Rhizobium leguminosarum bv. viciae]MBX4937048.1 hypothetical protein [Rhizobium binae]MBX4943698.1 hypothetical protein [Rhizobium binae]MBX4979142.1 hypothetical protein [Rhizobium binae]MBX4995879.1 hypothetical protein [Rhizobium binae]
MSRPTFATLKAMNAEFFEGCWDEKDLEQLVAPTFGVVSSFEKVISDLQRIVSKDLGQVGPDDHCSGLTND